MNPTTIISAAFAKGGVSKSTLAWALCSILSRDHKVLAIDVDPQGSLTSALTDSASPTIYDFIRHGLEIRQAITPALPAYRGSLSTIPASNLLSGLDAEMAGSFDRQFLLEPLRGLNDYKFIVIDCPSSQGLLTVGPLCISDYVISPVPCDPAAFEQVEAFCKTVELVQRRMNPKLRWLPLVATLFDQRNLLDREVLKAMREQHSVFKSAVRKTVRIKEEFAARIPCTHVDFINLTQEIIERINHDQKAVHAQEGAKGGATPPR